jgi:hypothetical protein
MKKRELFRGALLLGAGLIARVPGAEAAMSRGETTIGIIKAFFVAYTRRDIEACMACFDSGPEIFAFGSGPGEKRSGSEAIRQQLLADWAQTKEARLADTWLEVHRDAAVSWVASDVAVHVVTAEGAQDLAARATFVLRRRASRWRIVQMHFSLPV